MIKLSREDVGKWFVRRDGSVVQVTQALNNGGLYRFLCSGGVSVTVNGYVHVDQIGPKDLVARMIKLEVGKQYITRDGRLAKVIGTTGLERYPYTVFVVRGPMNASYAENGRYNVNIHSHDLDLVSEYLPTEEIKPTIKDIARNQMRVDMQPGCIVIKKQYQLFDEIQRHYPEYEKISQKPDMLVIAPKKQWRAYTKDELYCTFNPERNHLGTRVIQNIKTGTTAKVIGVTFDGDSVICAGRTVNYPISREKLVQSYQFVDDERCGVLA